ncbi:hypothetical protein [Parvicella tangerina]|uniref:Diaminopimelate decarboxylase n=1 Tax=Parvicella tangerina TaxID=2829795 RepID=A0A916NCA9_9FLAO|nr:hypothetical protein [Parvicella tangerina]CAG5084871.1 Diaminopimelate decarboxylase [Parvicella tangerina]
MKYITPEIAEQYFNDALNSKLIKSSKATIFYVKEILEDRLAYLQRDFPKNTLHAIAIKTNNHPEVLKHIVSLGYGLEAASLEEVELAKAAGAANFRIVFDSPVKTQEEIDFIVKEYPGMYVNANCLEELKRYPEYHELALGLRINPLVENDANGIFDVSNSTSKFGVPISREQEIIDACIEHKISTLHFHIGSGIKDFSANVRAAKKVIALAHKIDEVRKKKSLRERITTIDIGGGIQFDQEVTSQSTKAFVAALFQIDHLENYQLITEFGSFVHKHASFMISRVEYVIDNGDDIPNIAYLHVGADLFLRKVYANLDINYPYTVLGKNNSSSATKKYTIVGPLCFSGDVLYEGIELPELKSGDQFVMLDIGANTFSMWSGHCSRKKAHFILI